MGTETTSVVVHPEGEQPEIEVWSAVADTYAGRVHVEWDATAPVTPFGQLPFFIEYLKQGGLFDGWVADCPLSLSSPNASRKRDLLGTVLLSVRRFWRVIGATPTSRRCAAIGRALCDSRLADRRLMAMASHIWSSPNKICTGPGQQPRFPAITL